MHESQLKNHSNNFKLYNIASTQESFQTLFNLLVEVQPQKTWGLSGCDNYCFATCIFLFYPQHFCVKTNLFLSVLPLMLNALSPLPLNTNLFSSLQYSYIKLYLFSPFLSVPSFQPYETLLLYSHICMILFLTSFCLFSPQPRKKRLFFHFHSLNTYLRHRWPFLCLSAQQLRCIIEEDGYICYRIMLAAYIIEDKDFIRNGEKSNAKHLSETVKQACYGKFLSLLSELMPKTSQQWDVFTVLIAVQCSADPSW